MDAVIDLFMEADPNCQRCCAALFKLDVAIIFILE